jgi:UDP-2,3-diacylglucosamine pyrophosphatase LpxH
VSTLVISDLHLGAVSRADVARRREPLDALLAAVREADRLVLLGDTLELRERPLRQVLAEAGPVLEELGGAIRGRPVAIVGGNHDHELGAQWLDRLRLDGAEEGLGLEQLVPASEAPGALLGWVADRLRAPDLTFAYPGLQLRDDVYAIHGHYLDVHLTTPRPESLIARLLARSARGRDAPHSAPAHYEHTLAPMYALFYRIAQGDTRARSLARGRNLSRMVFDAANGRGSIAGKLFARVGVPVGVAALNAVGAGPFRAELSAAELRRSALAAMTESLRRLGVESEHVVFGHTHRLGPLPGDDRSEWTPPGAPRLWNSGSWFLEPALVGDRASASPYWPGGCVVVPDSGPPEPRNLLNQVALAAANAGLGPV